MNSAYPAALQHVPDLNDGTWVYHENDPGNLPFAMYHVRYSGTRRDIPGAFFRRNPKGTVCYPMNVTGWYWSPEVATGREYCDRGYGSMEILEVWEYRANDEARKPFDFIPPLYRERKALKAAGDGAHVGIKLGLNSLYGKLAQQVGAKQDAATGDWRLPPFHQLEWAGYTTSYCRARVLSAVLDNLDSVIDHVEVISGTVHGVNSVLRHLLCHVVNEVKRVICTDSVRVYVIVVISVSVAYCEHDITVYTVVAGDPFTVPCDERTRQVIAL